MNWLASSPKNVIASAPAASVEASQVAELALVSGTTYANPFMDAQLDAVVPQPDGTHLRVPGFWAGGTDFTVETSAALTGTWAAEPLGGNVTLTGNNLKYVFPSPLGSKLFARLKVTGP